MPQEEICRNRIISENYRDFIVNQLRGNILTLFLQKNFANRVWNTYIKQSM